MTADPTRPIDYERPSELASAGAWRLLRLAIVLWAALVLVRHTTYWTGVILDRPSPSSSGSVAKVSAGVDYSFAGIEALAEAIILLVLLAIAFANGIATPRVLRAVRWLCIAFLLLVVTDLLLNNDQLRYNAYGPGGGRARGNLRLIWLGVSKVQLLVVPIVGAVSVRR